MKKIVLLTVVIFSFFWACDTPEDCTLVARQPIGNWELITAYPSNIITPPSGGNVGVANVICYYKRTCVYWFECCGKYFPVSGTEFGSSDPGPGTTQPVITIGMPLPFQGALGQVASSLGVSLEIATWFQDQAAADASCGAAMGVNHEVDYYEATPKCDGTKIILPWYEWSLENALDNLPEEVEQIP